MKCDGVEVVGLTRLDLEKLFDISRRNQRQPVSQPAGRQSVQPERVHRSESYSTRY